MWHSGGLGSACLPVRLKRSWSSFKIGLGAAATTDAGNLVFGTIGWAKLQPPILLPEETNRAIRNYAIWIYTRMRAKKSHYWEEFHKFYYKIEYFETKKLIALLWNRTVWIHSVDSTLFDDLLYLVKTPKLLKMGLLNILEFLM